MCVNEGPGSRALVRYARRLADRFRAPWTAVHIETSRTQRLDEAERDRIAASLRLAETLGGEAVTIPAADGKLHAWLHKNCEVASDVLSGDSELKLEVFMTDDDVARLRAMSADVVVTE